MKAINKILLSLTMSAISSATFTYAQTLELVEDIGIAAPEYTYSSAPKFLTEFNGKLYFQAQKAGYGRELFSFDGVSSTIEIDLEPLGNSSSPSYLTVADNHLYFTTEGSGSMVLQKFDGTNPPVSITTLNTQIINNFLGLYEFNNKIITMVHNGSTNEWELTEFDSGNNPTVLFTVSGGSNFCPIRALTTFNGELYFYSNGLRKYDGTNPVTLIPNSAIYTSVVAMTVFNNEIYFSGYDNAYGMELRKYDGTNPPSLVFDLQVGTQSGLSNFYNDLAIINNELYFVGNDGVTGIELYKTDGITPTLIDINPAGPSNPLHFTVYNNKLYFEAFLPTTFPELWEYDGTNASMVEDLWPGALSSGIPSLAVFQNDLYFSANDGVVGQELFKFDGTNVSLAANIFDGNYGSAPSELTTYQNKLYFKAIGPDGAELWETDGVTTTQVVDLYTGVNSQQQPNSSDPTNLFTFNGKLFFKANNGTQQHVYEYNNSGTPTISTDLQADFYSFYIFNNELYFTRDDGTNGYELWKYDGVNAPVMVADINPGPNSSSPSQFCVNNGKLVFSAYDDIHGSELWEYDGVSAPVLVGDINPGIDDSYPSSLSSINGTVYFNAYTDAIGTELYSYDGVNPPSLVADLAPGMNNGYPNESYPYGFELLNNKVVFSASDANGNSNIWEYDGTNAPVMVTNFPATNYSNQLLIRGVIDDELYFWADEGINLGRELYRYDGINAPIMIDELSPGPLSSSSQSPSNIVELNGYIYTGANDWVIGGAFGRGELYRFQSCASFIVSISQNNTSLEADPGYVSYQWYDANGPISGETNSSFTFSTNGTYYCEVVNSNNCSAVSNSITVMNAGLETTNVSNIRVYPNPTQGTITLKSDTPIESIVILSATGKVLGVFHETTIDLSQFSHGVYIAQITSNGTTTIHRIVKD